MPKEEEDQFLTFTITIVSVKMKVKFPCKMAIEQSGRPLTNEVPSNEEGRFLFNQEVRLREESQKLFTELSISLVTEKGARYISGVVKLYHSELIRSESDRLVITLSKCLDTEAFCELRVDKVVRQGGGRKRTLTTLPQKHIKLTSPKQNDEANHMMTDFRSPRKMQLNQVGYDSRSQTYFPVTANIKLGRVEDDLRMRDFVGTSGLPASFRKQNPSPKGRSRPLNSKNKYIQFSNAEHQREKMMQAEVYKQNYQKLKQKYLRQTQISKAQTSKRMILQNNENNFKLQIVKLKLKNEQLQKTVMDKNSRLKQLSITLSSLQSREAELNMLREDLANKEHAINIMDDTIVTLSKENDDLRMNSKEASYHLQQKLLMLENQYQIAVAKANAKQQELERELKNANDTLQHRDLELSKKNDMLEKQKHTVNQLERTLQNRMFEFDSHLQNERTQGKQKIQEGRNKIEELNQILVKGNAEKGQLVTEVDKYKGLLLKNQYEFKLFQQQMNTLRTEIEQLRPIRDKYNDIIKELRSVSQQKIILEKSHQKFILTKENAFDDISKEYKKQTQNSKKIIKQYEQKSKNLSAKLFETESQLELAKGSLQKYKKNSEASAKEVSELREKQKSLRKASKVKEEEFEDSKKELLRVKQKNQSLMQSTKIEFSKAREELAKTKIDLESEMVKNEQLVQTNSDLNMELARMKMTHQFSDEKYQKLSESAQQKYYQFQKIIKEHESVIDLLEEKIRNQKDNEKDFYGKLQKCDYEITMVVDKNDKMVKQMKTLEQRNRQLEVALKSKQLELVDALKKITDTETKVYSAEEQAKELKDQLQFNSNELEKNKKIVEIVQRDYDKVKTDIIAYCQKLNQREKELDDKSSEAKRYQDTILDLETRHATLKKEYDRFKDSVSDALNSSFTQVIQAFAMEKDSVKVSTNYSSPDFQSMTLKRGISDLNNELVNAINSAGKESKGQISKLTDKIRVLQRDLDLLRNEMQRTQDSSKKQIQQKTKYIEQLQDVLRTVKNEKGENQVQTNIHIQQMEIELRHYQEECNILESNKNELQFSIKGLRMEVERISEEYDKKFYQLITDKEDLQEKLQYQYHNTEVVEKKLHELQVQMMNINSVVIVQKEQSYKKELRITELQQQKQHLSTEIAVSKKKLKESQERYSELQIQYITIKEIKEKYEIMLTEEEVKLKDVRSFNNNILKEKEEIIKKELEKNIEITELENSITDLKHQLLQSEDLKNKYKTDLEEIKESAKRSNGQVKDLENGFSQEKVRYNDIRDKLREKEQQLTEAKEEVLSLKKKMEEEKQKGKIALEQLREENDMLMKQLQTINLQSSQSIRGLQSQVSKQSQSLQASKEQVSELQEALFVERENNSSMQQSINKLRLDLQDFRKKLEQMQKINDQIMQQNREKDEHMFELGGKLYEYQNRMHQMEEDKQRQMQQLNNNLNVKYDEDYQQINQKIELIEKEKEYFKQKFSEKEQELAKKAEELKHREIEEIEIKKAFEEKIKKIEDQKLVMFSDKNKEIAKILEENKTQFQNLRAKDTELRKIIHELEISRNSIQKLEAKIKEMQNDRSTQIKAYQGQIENFRKKDLVFKSYKDTVKSNQWNCEREVRKLIQAFIKKVLESGEKQVRNQSLISSIKGMEEGMLNAIAAVGKQSQ